MLPLTTSRSLKEEIWTVRIQWERYKVTIGGKYWQCLFLQTSQVGDKGDTIPVPCRFVFLGGDTFLKKSNRFWKRESDRQSHLCHRMLQNLTTSRMLWILLQKTHGWVDERQGWWIFIQIKESWKLKKNSLLFLWERKRNNFVLVRNWTCLFHNNVIIILTMSIHHIGANQIANVRKLRQ